MYVWNVTDVFIEKSWAIEILFSGCKFKEASFLYLQNFGLENMDQA
jgi:hypothetical protein